MSSQIIELAGCDLLTISPELLIGTLRSRTSQWSESSTRRRRKTPNVKKLELDEKKFRYLVQ